MLTDSQKRIKGCVWHPVVKPAGVILDPDLTVGLPRSLTAWTGIDALVHAIEAYCVPATHPMCDGMALEALRLIAPALPRVLVTPDDIAARGAILTGSCLAGVAFQKGLGLVHAISHMIGAEFDSHHGLTNAVLLPVVLRFNQAEIAAAVPQMAQAMHLPDTGFDDFLRAINHLLDVCDIPKTLADFGVQPTDIPRLAQKAHKDIAQTTNPRQASIADIEGLIKQALLAARP
jgi:alcohol dehydrogenase class IV